MRSKGMYVIGRLRDRKLPELLDLAGAVLSEWDDDHLQDMVDRASTTGVAGELKNLIFASIGPKPEIVLRDALNNAVEITKGADSCLIYDRPLPEAGLTWPSRALRPLSIGLAVATTAWTWPTSGVRDALSDALHWGVSPDLWDAVRRYLPLGLVVVAALLLLPRSPLVDRVRARDEAAKDANRLLAELAGRTAKLYYSASRWQTNWSAAALS
jgi:hypothetical protein